MNSTDLQHQFRRVSADCIRLYRLTLRETLSAPLSDVVDELRLLLERIWGGLAKTYAARTEGWEADAKNLGYLTLKGHQTEVRVPYHLAPDFPVGSTLAGLTDLGLRVRSSIDGVICLSGSSTFWEALQVVADIDFCEYVPVEPECQKDGLWEQLHKSSENLICMRAKAFDNRGASVDLTNVSVTPMVQHAKLDYIAVLTDEVVETTNVILYIIKDDSDDPALKKSYAFQEAPITDGEWVPRKLLDPISLGRYAVWLQEQVRQKMELTPIKAAKRGLSLARITGHNDHGDKLIATLQSSTELVATAIEARSHLVQNITQLKETKPEIADPLLRSFNNTLKKLRDALAGRRSRVDSNSEQQYDHHEMSLQYILHSLLGEIDRSIDTTRMG